MSTANPTSLHGQVDNGLAGFSRLLDPDPDQPAPQDLIDLASEQGMADAEEELGDAPDAEENLYVPAGYTYLGQFVDHDLTFDTTSTLDPMDNSRPTNRRTPCFDLDSLYGLGPIASPYMYRDGIRLIEGVNDLPRQGGRAIVGDPRNDENSIICNLHMAFIRFHNAVADRLEAARPALKNSRELFDLARNEVRWTYQRILVEDFLPRIVSNETLQAFEFRRDPAPSGLSRNVAAFALYTPDKRGAIPLEFSAAAFRFGHSMVRTGYHLNDRFGALIFAKNEAQPNPDNSLIGLQPLPPNHVIDDWGLFFPRPDGRSRSSTPGDKDEHNDEGAGGDVRRLQFAYRIDTTFVNPLAYLPPQVVNNDGMGNLGARNLLRGRKLQLPCGQAVGEALGVPLLDRCHLVLRDKGAGDGMQTFKPLPPQLSIKTPLWFYLLAEAQAPLVDWWLRRPLDGDGRPQAFSEEELLAAAGATATQLGETGGRIVLEVFHGLLDADAESYRNHPAAADWSPLLKEMRMWHLIHQVWA